MTAIPPLDLAAVDAVLLDLDGTLVDSAPDMALAVDATLEALGRAKAGVERVRQWVGNGAERLLHRALTFDLDGQAPPELVERARPLFYDFYRRFLVVHTAPYPGVEAGLAALAEAGYPLACVTNKPTAAARALVAHFPFGAHLATVVGGDCANAKKPDPAPVFLAAERLGVAVDRLLMVGDSISDVQAARRAGCGVVAVPYGYNHRRPIEEAQPDAVVPSLEALAALLAQVRGLG
ncbi:MAG: phosphoglycolate phosphatase [Candidatus Competibacterales bacterium]